MRISIGIILIMSIGLLLLSSFSASAGSIDDQPNDVIHYKWSDINDWYFELEVEEKQSIDIDEMSLEIVGEQAVFTMTLYGNVMTDQLYYYMGTYSSDEATYFFIYGTSPEGETASSGVWSTSTGSGPATSVIADGKKIEATFDTNIEGSTNVDIWGVATEYTEYGNSLVEHWVDYSPDDKFEGDLFDPDNGNGNNTNETTNKKDDGTPGFEAIALLAAVAVALVLLKRRR